MKHKTNVGPGLIVALGAPADSGGSATGDRATGKDNPSSLRSDAASTDDPNALSEAENVDTVPLDMLSMPDDQEQMQPPEVGDVVNYQVTGKVVAIEGNEAKVQRQSINGQELPGSEDEADDSNTQGSDTGSGGSGSTNGDGGEAAGLRNQAAGIGMLS